MRGQKASEMASGGEFKGCLWFLLNEEERHPGMMTMGFCKGEITCDTTKTYMSYGEKIASLKCQAQQTFVQ